LKRLLFLAVVHSELSAITHYAKPGRWLRGILNYLSRN
jgi:hypothetical protein